MTLVIATVFAGLDMPACKVRFWYEWLI